MAIICGIDFSEPSGRAARVAAALARARQQTLWLLHATEHPATEPAQRVEEEHRLRERLKEEVRRLGAGVEIRTEIRAGLPDQELLDLARRQSASLIVVAALGRRSEQRFRLGSVADRLCQNDDFPVLVVRDSRPFESWQAGKQPLRVLVGMSGDESDRRAIESLSAWREAGPCNVTGAQIYWPPEQQRRLGGDSPINLVGANPVVESLLTRARLEELGSLKGKGDVAVMVRSSLGRVSDGLRELALEESTDLVVVGSHRLTRAERWWYGSVSQAVVHGVHCSVLKVPSDADEDSSFEPAARVLIPIDFSDGSRRAIGRGLAILASGGRARLLHVAPAQGGPGEEELSAMLRAAVPHGVARRGLRVDVEVVTSGNPAEAICQAAERFDADFICMGTHGRGAIGKLALGSIADEVVRKARRPVVLVKPAPKE
jgi:nucleotide-binding universal stress UspA family protein